jgi:hypothetical protein
MEVIDPADVGTRFDPPATIDQLATATPTDGSPAPTLFSLLKGMLLHLSAIIDGATGK